MLLPLSQIVVPPRQREQIGERALRELANSIAELGLLHPIVVRYKQDVYDDITSSNIPQYELVCGERRLRAHELLFKEGRKPRSGELNHVSALEITELTEAERVQAELEENLLRVDLTWQESARALDKLHKLRLEANPQHTLKETIEEIQAAGSSAAYTTLQKQIQAAANVVPLLDVEDSSIRNARSLQEANAIYLKRMEADIASRLASSENFPQLHTLYHGDLRKQLQTLERNQFDVIIADPPYGMDADSFGSDKTRHAYQDDEAYAIDLASNIICEGFELAKPQAFLFLFCDVDNFLRLRELARSANWQTWRTPLIWHKPRTSGTEPIPGRGFFRSYELILYAIKGNRARQEASSDVISIPAIEDPTHTAAKPPELYKHLLRRSCSPGDNILDPCCGVGTIFVAANELQLRATGIELSEANVKLAARHYGVTRNEDTSQC